MTEEFLQKIRVKSNEEISKLEEYNKQTRMINQMILKEKLKKSLGLPYNENILNMYIPEKTEESIILSTYKKYIGEIDEKDTNGIYVYICTKKYTNYTSEQIDNGYPIAVETSINDPEADYKCYYNLEGCLSYKVNIDDCEEFERKNIVIYGDFYKLEQDFIITAVKEGQERAIKKIIKSKSA